MTLAEQDFQQQVIDLAHVYGWRVAHFRPARTANGGWRTAVAGDGAGFPDLVLVRPPELIFAELKTERGRLSAAQQDWVGALALVEEALAAGAPPERRLLEVNVWRPTDFDAINARLRPRPTQVAA